MEIKVNVEELENKTSELSSVRNTMEDLMQNLKTTVDGLAESWEAEAGNTFIGRFGSVFTEIGDSLTNLDTHINKLGQAAEAYRELGSTNEGVMNELPTDNIF